MRKDIALDHLLENAVAEALGLAKPHREASKKLRADRARHLRRYHAAGARPSRDHGRVAA